MLRMLDFFCPVCMNEWEEITRVGEAAPKCCGESARVKIAAPAIRFMKPHYNPYLGKFVKDSADFERKLRAGEYYVPTGNDLSRIMNTSTEDIRAAQKKAREPKIRETAEKTWSALHLEGKV